jgi:hypothetical protein
MVAGSRPGTLAGTGSVATDQIGDRKIGVSNDAGDGHVNGQPTGPDASGPDASDTAAPGPDASDPAAAGPSPGGSGGPAGVDGPTAGQPFTAKQLRRLAEALTLSSRETGITFSVYVGPLAEPTRQHAESLHDQLAEQAPHAVLIAVDPGQRQLEIVTDEPSAKRLPDRACALAALSMTASFSVGDLTGGLVDGLRMLCDRAGRRR